MTTVEGIGRGRSAYCYICEKQVMNFANGRRSEKVGVLFPFADCLTVPLIEDILKTSAYEKRTAGAPPVKNPPAEKSKTLSSGSERAKRDNARSAASVLREWKAAGLTDNAKFYVKTNHHNLEDFLKSHHHIDVGERNAVASSTDDGSAAQSNPEAAGGYPEATNEAADATVAVPAIVCFEDEENYPWYESDVLVPGLEDYESESEVDDFEWIVDDEVDLEDDDESQQGASSAGLESVEPSQASLEVGGGTGESEVPLYTLEKRQATHREAFEMIKATLVLTDEETSTMLAIWKNLQPVPDWKNFVTDGRLLARPAKNYSHIKPRRVACGFTKADGVPYHDEEKQREMMERFAAKGHTVPEEKIQHWGDCVDFGIEDSLLMRSPGNLHPKGHKMLLKRVHAADPNMLSLPFLQIVDKELYNQERLKPNPLRSKMNFFSLKKHADGVQIAKNSTASEGLPVSFAIDKVAPYDPDTGTVDFKRAIVVPARMATVHTITVYHGRGKCDLFAMLQHCRDEEYRLHPGNRQPDDEASSSSREMVVEMLMVIADTPMKAQLTGE
jgi:hypothetical protein